MNKVDFLILGGGIAGTSAAETIRNQDQNASITILTEEADRLYSRVLLPHYLRGENTFESLYVRTPISYIDKKIELKTTTKVSKLDLTHKQVATESGEVYEFGKLLVATGGKVNRLTIPGADLKGIFYLRTIVDAGAIMSYLPSCQNALVLGGGFIGMEFAQSFVKNGLKTTAIIREKYFWENVVGENSGKLLSEILTSNGVDLISQAQAVEFTGSTKLIGLKLSDGQEVKADIAGVGVGIHLELDHLQDSGLVIKKGVVTNEYLETSVPDVWAAGDIAEFYDVVFGKYHTLGNWANASAQGRSVGLNMAGIKTVFETTSMYSINVFGNNFSFLGDPAADEKTETIERGDISSKKLARFLLRDSVVVGASLINMPVERNIINKLIKEKIKLTASVEQLADANFDLTTLIT